MTMSDFWCKCMDGCCPSEQELPEEVTEECTEECADDAGGGEGDDAMDESNEDNTGNNDENVDEPIADCQSGDKPPPNDCQTGGFPPGVENGADDLIPPDNTKPEFNPDDDGMDDEPYDGDDEPDKEDLSTILAGGGDLCDCNNPRFEQFCEEGRCKKDDTTNEDDGMDDQDPLQDDDPSTNGGVITGGNDGDDGMDDDGNDDDGIDDGGVDDGGADGGGGDDPNEDDPIIEEDPPGDDPPLPPADDVDIGEDQDPFIEPFKEEVESLEDITQAVLAVDEEIDLAAADGDVTPEEQELIWARAQNAKELAAAFDPEPNPDLPGDYNLDGKVDPLDDEPKKIIDEIVNQMGDIQQSLPDVDPVTGKKRKREDEPTDDGMDDGDDVQEPPTNKPRETPAEPPVDIPPIPPGYQPDNGLGADDLFDPDGNPKDPKVGDTMDTDGDGVPDTELVDTDGDGAPDSSAPIPEPVVPPVVLPPAEPIEPIPQPIEDPFTQPITDPEPPRDPAQPEAPPEAPENLPQPPPDTDADVSTDFLNEPVFGRRFAFILDKSGSMVQGEQEGVGNALYSPLPPRSACRWNILVGNVVRFLYSLPDSAEVWIGCFSSDGYTKVGNIHFKDEVYNGGKWTPASERLAIATWLYAMLIDGMTEPKKMIRAVKQVSPAPDMLLFLTDGVFTESGVDKEFKGFKSQSKFFTVVMTTKSALMQAKSNLNLCINQINLSQGRKAADRTYNTYSHIDYTTLTDLANGGET